MEPTQLITTAPICISATRDGSKLYVREPSGQMVRCQQAPTQL